MNTAWIPVHDGLFAVGAGGDVEGTYLLGSRCDQCATHHFPVHQTCPYCSSEDVEPCELSSQGVLWAWTAVTAAPPGYRGDVPFGFGVVELPEGVRVVTRLTESDPGRLEAGQPMALVVVPLHTDDDGRTVSTFAFAPLQWTEPVGRGAAESAGR
jgi:uncharacterized protein